MRNKVTWFLVGIFVLSFVLASFGSELEEIQKAIKEKGAKWVAGETSVLRMAPEQRRKLLGDLPAEKPKGGLVSLPLSGVALPDTFDWRDYLGHNWMTSIKDQGSCGNCWAMAACGALEATTRITMNEPNMPLNLSEMFLTWCTGRGCDLGWDQTSTLNYIKNNGVPDEACLPQSGTACSDSCADRYVRSVFIKSFGYEDFPSVETIKDRIMNYGPVTVHCEIFTDFYGYHSGIYTHTWGTSEGWHAVSLVGWNQQDTCWIAKNSWGTDWGEAGGGQDGGWFRVRMIDNGIHIDEAIWYMVPDTASVHELIVKSPNGGEAWIAEEWYSVNWFSPYFSGNVNLEYSTNGGTSWNSINPSAYNDGDESWFLPDVVSPNCRVRVSDAVDGDPSDVSNGNFIITKRGDLNRNGSIAVDDVIFLANYILKGAPVPNPIILADVNCDGFYDLIDVIALANYLLKGTPITGC
jgi:hypothetical protein